MSEAQHLISVAADGHPEEVENAWLAAVADQPTDLEPFVRAAETLARRGEEQLAGTLLELLDEQLCESGAWNERLDLLRRCGRRYVRAGHIHETALATVANLYRGREDDLEVALAAVGLDKGKDETPRLWDKVERLRSLLVFEEGVIVAMEGRGVGRITEVNLALQTLKIDFEEVKGMAVGLRAAAKLLEVLPEGHVLRLKLEEPDRLVAMSQEELLATTFHSYGRPLKAAEIRQTLSGIVDDKKWTSWWNAARKLPRLLVEGTGARAIYSWLDTAEEVGEQLLEQLEQAEPRAKLDVFKRAWDHGGDIAELAFERLSAWGCERLDESPAEAFEIWLGLSRVRAPEWSAVPALSEHPEPQRLLDQLSTRAARERALELMREHRADWAEVFEDRFLTETDGRTLGFLLDRLEKAERPIERLLDRALAQPAKTPVVFTWVAERAAEDELLRQRHGLRLLRQIVRALAQDELSSQRKRLEALLESGGTVARILPELDESEAVEAQRILETATGLEQYQREPLLNALHLRFPHLEREEEEPLYTLAASLEAKREELRRLAEEELPANRRAIEEARAHGDLRENFEYKAARQRHEYLSARATALADQIHRAKVLDPNQVDTSEVRIGTKITLAGLEGAPHRELTVLGPWESAPDEGVISYQSDLGNALLGKTPGDRVEIEGVPYRIESISALDS